MNEPTSNWEQRARAAEAELERVKGELELSKSEYEGQREMTDSQFQTAENLRSELERMQAITTEMLEALRPFAAIGPVRLGSIPPDKLWLWKATSTLEEMPGISAAYIDRARQAWETAKKLGLLK